MTKKDAIEFLLVLKNNVEPVHIKNSKGEFIYSALGFCDAIDMAITELTKNKE